ncbi:hypothetical protein BACEGG_02840 [Bacteroides eggerthii DSM 20697]|nr:hypothetical protein BACEGG_02840 [Bacteroides eggerthii DSM 20697]
MRYKTYAFWRRSFAALQHLENIINKMMVPLNVVKKSNQMVLQY